MQTHLTELGKGLGGGFSVSLRPGTSAQVCLGFGVG